MLNKPAKLSDEEYLHIMEHTVIGEKILAPLLKDRPRILQIVRSHHERMDGTGLPDGLKGEAIPQAARIVTVVDAFDAMTTGRAYRPPLPAPAVMQELHAECGRQFDPAVVAAFEQAFADLARLPIATPIAVGALHEAAVAALSR